MFLAVTSMILFLHITTLPTQTTKNFDNIKINFCGTTAVKDKICTNCHVYKGWLNERLKLASK